MNEFNLDAAKTDDDFFGVLESGQTNLNQIFGVAPRQQHENHTLKYQAPKQMNSTQSEHANQPWSSQLAKVVTAYKDSVAMGKVGVALLRNAKDEYKIIVYKSKSNVLATCTLQFSSTTSTAVYRQQPYLQFYDGAQSYWSLLFEKEDDETEFVKILETIAVKIIELETQPKVLPQIGMPKNDEVEPIANSKNALVTRMAKMGQKLPKFTAVGTTTECSDDSTDAELITTPLAGGSNKPAIAGGRSRPTIQKTQLAKTVGVYTCPTNLSAENHCMQIMLTENRTQNTEMRMNINKLESKIEKFLDKIEVLGSGIATSTMRPHKEDEMLELEEKMLELRKENRKLRQTLESSNAQKSQKSVEKFISGHASQLKDLELSASNDWEELSDDLLDNSLNLQANLKQLQAKNETLTQQLREKNNKLTEQKQQLEERQEKVKTLEEELQEANKTNDKLRRTLHDLKEELQAQQSSEPHKKLATETRRAVKEIMNSLYSSLASQLDAVPGGSLSNDHILSIVGKLIKYETLQAIQPK